MPLIVTISLIELGNLEGGHLIWCALTLSHEERGRDKIRFFPWAILGLGLP